MKPGTGPDIDHVIRRPDHILIMLHHDQRVADIPERPQCPDQFPVVPLVQPDGGFVEHIDHPHQVGTDLCGKPDPLRFAAGQGAGIPREREVAKPHFLQELQP